uniref:Uncharacterized protein n=1 Tax=Nelumbo nucifera TaxID=4432 RepID=A0A822ZTP3_NELNU|nr:TPA_asm: hypothetical protein HUJ06_017847 [Nelumbo nucifera]
MPRLSPFSYFLLMLLVLASVDEMMVLVPQAEAKLCTVVILHVNCRREEICKKKCLESYNGTGSCERWDFLQCVCRYHSSGRC